MKAKFTYHSVFAPYFEKFILLKQSQGYMALQTGWILLEFDRFFIEKEVTSLHITRELIDQWRSTRLNDAPVTLYMKYSVWSQFGRFMCRFGHACFIPRMPASSPMKNSFIPYVFSQRQISDIFRSCDELRIYDRHMSTILFIIPAIIRLLYGTGLRISEALSLKNGDIDLNDWLLYVRKSKNGEPRLIPLSNTLVAVLRQYSRYRNRLPIPRIRDEEGYFFVSPNGERCFSGSVYKWFRKVLSSSGISYQGNHKGPRVHDLRHTFAVHSMAGMVKAGLDSFYALPLLSTYLGHKSPDSTEKYVRLTREMYPDLLRDEKNHLACVYPQP